MALEDMKIGRRRYTGNVYDILRRFLNSNIGKNWDDLYSKLCAVARANTSLGDEIRYAVGSMVDPSPTAIWHGDYYVDVRGLLRKDNTHAWKTEAKKRQNEKPIIHIAWIIDGNNVWYEYTHTSIHWQGLKCIKSKQMEWFEFIKTFIDKTRPIYQYDEHGNRTEAGVKHYVEEEIHRRQCNHKEVKILRAIATRKITAHKLTYNYNSPGLTAIMSGKRWSVCSKS